MEQQKTQISERGLKAQESRRQIQIPAINRTPEIPYEITVCWAENPTGYKVIKR